VILKIEETSGLKMFDRNRFHLTKEGMGQGHRGSGADVTHIADHSLTVISTLAGSVPASSFPVTTATYCRDQRASLARE